MKVLMLSTDSNILKEESAVRGRMIWYGKAADELHIIIPTVGGEKGKIPISENVFIYPTASRSKLLSRFGLWSVGRNISADIVTAQDPFETGLMAWLIAKNTGAKLELQIHTDFLSPYFSRESFLNKIRVKIAKFTLPKADGVRVVSRRIKDSLKVKSYKLKVSPVVLPVFVDVEKFYKSEPAVDLRKKYPQFDFIVLMASRLAGEKNIGLAIEVMREVVKNYPETGLVIVGSGPEHEALKSQVASYKLQANVVFEPWTNNIASYMKTANVFLNTSNYDGFALTLLEAAAAGLPIVSTDVGLVGDILLADEEILVCPVGDKECVADRLERLIKFPALRKELALKAQSAVHATISGSAEEYLNRLRESWSRLMVK